MRGIHTWDLGKGKTETSSGESREALAVGNAKWRAVEAEEEILILGEKLVAINYTIYLLKLSRVDVWERPYLSAWFSLEVKLASEELSLT